MRTVTIGNFDGVHLGHMKVLEEAMSCGGPVTAVCFEPVTRQYFNPGRWSRRLTTSWERFSILKDRGVDRVQLVPFHSGTATQGPGEFLEELLDGTDTGRVVVGYDFHFGIRRTGTVELLERWCTSRGIGTIIVPPLEIGHEPVKSERIRLLLDRGETVQANGLLGRPYSLTGVVARGKGLGRELGFPTLNLRVACCKLLPVSGSYCGYVYSTDVGERMAAAVFVPGTEGGPVEAYVPGRRLDEVYGSLMRMEIVERIRERAFPGSMDELRELIAGDVDAVMEFDQLKGRMEDPVE
ncbi:MAG: hypothetical protein AVO35_10170 [Candidatus Aegiribacteria sp. MLS_C]|nr:MAG: hypothetical protein AVO35_10170 [Candidatus Aegiribacteria sp. MLS_C]